MRLHKPTPFRPLSHGFGIIVCEVCDAAQPWPLPQLDDGTQRRWFVEGHNVGSDCIGRRYTPFEMEAMRCDSGSRVRVEPSDGDAPTVVAAVHRLPAGYGVLTVGQRYRVTQSRQTEGTLDSVLIVNNALTGVIIDGRAVALSPLDTVEAL